MNILVRPLKFFILIGIFLTHFEAWSQYQWPFPNSGVQGAITGSVGEFRQTAGSSNLRFHKGIDLTNGGNLAVHAINAGTVTWNGSTQALSSTVTVTTGGTAIRYIHILPKLSIQNGSQTTVALSEYLGDMIVYGNTHLHLEEETTNFLDHNLYPFEDDAAPYFEDDFIPNAVAFYRNGLRKTSDPSSFLLNTTVNINGENRKVVHGKIDIGAHAIDPRTNPNGTSGGGVCVPTEIAWQIKNSANQTVEFQQFRFDGIPNNAAAVYAFHPSSNPPDPSRSIHIITSHPRTSPYDPVLELQANGESNRNLGTYIPASEP